MAAQLPSRNLTFSQGSSKRREGSDDLRNHKGKEILGLREDPCPEAQEPQLFCLPSQSAKQVPRETPPPRCFFSFLFFFNPFWRMCETDFFFSFKLYETTLFFCGVLETDFSG